MSDAFLSAHWTAARTYDISAEVSPVSIRDQMIRGRLFAERAVALRLIARHPDEGLVVVGAGAAGMTAAMRAAELGVPTLVLDSSALLFRTQANCTTRWIDPTQYDWPRDHWRNGTCPHRGSPMPLSWQAGRADAVAAAWFVAVQSAVGPLLRVVQSIRALAVDHTGGNFAVKYKNGRLFSSHRQPCGALLLAAGFGAENVEVGPRYRGFAFWESDPFTAGKLRGNPLNPRQPGPRVLISGGGDGALQDYLRIMTQRASPREIMEYCGLSDQLPQKLKDLDRSVNSAHIWSNRAGNHSWNELLDHECKTLAREELKSDTVNRQLTDLLAARPRLLQLIHGCTHLTAFYLLNRFLVWLIDEHLLQTKEPSSLTNQSRLVAVDSADSRHQCSNDPSACFDVPHEVRIVADPNCTQSPNSAASRSTWDVVIVRHGIKLGARPLNALRRLSLRRQVLPDFLP